MTISHILFVLLLCVLIGSYTWGMRGTIIGGERGAMLPGAALALVLIFADGTAPVAAAYQLAASIGAAAMFFGGSQTYGETIGLTADADPKTRLRGRIGLAIKGAGWFGVFGGILGFGLGTIAGRYSLWEAELFVVLLPIMRGLGILLLNASRDLKKDHLPKLYFSKKRSEVWGGMAMVVLYILVFCACKKEWFAVLLCMFGMIFGAIGFCVGNLLQNFADAHLSKTWISGWKMMECTFGAIGAFGIGLGWCLLYGPFVSRYSFEITAHSGAWVAASGKAYVRLGFVWLLLLAVFIARYWFPHPNLKKGSKLSKILYDIEDILIWPVFCLIPLLWAAIGDKFFARIFSCFGIFYLLADKIVFGGKKRNEKHSLAVYVHAVLVVLSAALLGAHLFLSFRPSAYMLWSIYLLAYLLTAYVLVLDPKRLRRQREQTGSWKDALLSLGAEPSWLIYAGLSVIVLLILGKPYFTL